MWFNNSSMVSKGRQHVNSLLTWKVLIFCVVSLGTCVVSGICQFKNVTKVSRLDPPRPVLAYYISRFTTDFKCLLLQFIADKETGKVCFQDEGNSMKIDNTNIELKVYDGGAETLLIKYTREFIGYREYCSTSQSLEFFFRRLNNDSPLYPDLLYINIQVIHIESVFRVVFMNERFCGNKVRIANSRVRVYSKFPNIGIDIRQICQVMFVKVLQERQLCLFYKLRSEKWVQLFDWDIYVSIVKYSLSPENVVYKFNSRNESSGKWCDEANRENIYVIYKTNQTEPFPSDPPVFMILVTDVETQSTDNATSVTPWWSMDYSPTQSTPTNGFSEIVSSHSMAVLVSLVTNAAIDVLLC
ncbi:uncharacterized protein LOC106056732 [Biomphalaria glabrata]|uniref:Uncharacterized protein LOC106056732 n=1 Tax=Biomphalaria glabrata TaxID=6526 RepID=A0A9W3BNX6_BIOGL|nr:uncharacterized protein LOC106056732 [Biomphalaria glabrata]